MTSELIMSMCSHKDYNLNLTCDKCRMVSSGIRNELCLDHFPSLAICNDSIQFDVCDATDKGLLYMMNYLIRQGNVKIKKLNW